MTRQNLARSILREIVSWLAIFALLALVYVFAIKSLEKERTNETVRTTQQESTSVK